MQHPDCLAQTRHWIQTVVVGLDLCPFAAPVLRLDALTLRAVSGDTKTCLTELARECARLEPRPEIDTALLVLEAGFRDFPDYLDLLDLSEQLLDDLDYAGIFQLASFHPFYQFSGTQRDDVENFTNRSPYPMLQLLRESSVTRALSGHSDPASIPERNIERMRELGVEGVKALLAG